METFLTIIALIFIAVIALISITVAIFVVPMLFVSIHKRNFDKEEWNNGVSRYNGKRWVLYTKYSNYVLYYDGKHMRALNREIKTHFNQTLKSMCLYVLAKNKKNENIK